MFRVAQSRLAHNSETWVRIPCRQDFSHTVQFLKDRLKHYSLVGSTGPACERESRENAAWFLPMNKPLLHLKQKVQTLKLAKMRNFTPFPAKKLNNGNYLSNYSFMA